MTLSFSESQLLESYLAGDAGAFTALVELHQVPLLRYATTLLGSRNAAEDVVQEAFIRLARRPPELDTISSVESDPEGERSFQLSSWLHKVTRNLCMDLHRSEARRKRREQHAAVAERTGGELDTVEQQDTRAAVEKSLDRLPEDQREVLVLRLLGEKSYREIADITGKKSGTVGWLISVGLKALSADLSALCGDGRPRPLGEAQGELA